MAQRGYSRDKRPDCKQVCIGLVVSKCGMPLGYEVFEGNRTDVTTLKEIVETMEARYGKADRIWVGDRGMMSKKNIEFLKSGDRRYIIGAPKASLEAVRAGTAGRGLATDSRRPGSQAVRRSRRRGEVFILCRSRDRREKEAAMHGRFEAADREGTEEDPGQLPEAEMEEGNHRPANRHA